MPQTAVHKAVTPFDAYEPAETLDLKDDSLQRCMQLARYGYLLQQRRQWADHPMLQASLEAAHEEIDKAFVIVPEGFVSLARTIVDIPGAAETDIETEAFWLSRCCVTNRRFQMFVDSGGYEDLNLWPRDIWPHLIDFKDQTDKSGPRFWRDGRHDRRLADHPVVGICYYEAAAYAQWAGYRLPSGAEWQMAASWRIRSSAHVFRRYPWGDALDISRCNIWASNIGKTVPVDACPSGAAPNGILQLIGNVWEWTSSDFEVTDEYGRPVVGDMLLKEVRGGAYDTYFPAQATSVFRTGLPSLARVQNAGFRCAFDPPEDAAGLQGEPSV